EEIDGGRRGPVALRATPQRLIKGGSPRGRRRRRSQGAAGDRLDGGDGGCTAAAAPDPLPPSLSRSSADPANGADGDVDRGRPGQLSRRSFRRWADRPSGSDDDVG